MTWRSPAPISVSSPIARRRRYSKSTGARPCLVSDTEHAQAAQVFFKETLRELDYVADVFARLSARRCPDDTFDRFLKALLPEPKKPRNSENNPGLLRMWEKKCTEVQKAREKISELRESGKGMDLDGSHGTFWGVLNAVLEYFDHHREIEGSRIVYALFGDGMDLKVRAFRMIQEELAEAA